MDRRWLWAAPAVGIACAWAGACGGAVEAPASRTALGVAAVDVAPEAVARVELPACGRAGDETRGSRGDAAPAQGVGREAAQRGLDFLASDTIAWQRAQSCYGCHVQAVTLDAMIVGRRNSYVVAEEDFAVVLRGMLDIPGGARGPVGFSVRDDPRHLIETSKSFGGAALAEYDEHVARDLEPELLRVAEAILEYQEADGSVRSTDHRPPVVSGVVQSTTQAARTWRQAYARTADDRWLLPIARAEQYIRDRAVALTDEQATYLSDVSYAIVGLLAAGAGHGEQVVQLLADALRERQNADGGWGFRPGEASSAFATGQSLYVLRKLGTGDDDPAVARGTGWLLETQREDGSWSTGGDRRGEAMWAVLGLVSIDVLAVTTSGIEDGTHARETLPLRVRAVDTRGRPASSIEIRLDDAPVHRACEGTTTWQLRTEDLEAGAHRLDVLATDADGRQSRRAITFYTGEHYLTRVGSRFENGATRFSLRNVAPASLQNRVRLQVFRRGEGAEGEVVHERTVDGAQGAMSLAWDGRSAAGEMLPRGRYVAELAMLDAGGRVRQTVEVPFVHDTEEAQRAQFAEVSGRVDRQEADIAGATIELVDEQGNVVQRTTSTRSGQYRFRNVDGGRYRVRVNRRGVGTAEAEVRAAPASQSQADLSL